MYMHLAILFRGRCHSVLLPTSKTALSLMGIDCIELPGEATVKLARVQGQLKGLFLLGLLLSGLFWGIPSGLGCRMLAAAPYQAAMCIGHVVWLHLGIACRWA